MERTKSSPVAGHETNRQLSALGNISQQTLIAAVKANIRMGERGLGLIVIQNGSYLQITSLVEKSSAANDGKLKPGDVLVKIGHANVIGWTLRDLRQLLHNIPIGTTLQIKVYRDLVEVPQHWQNAAELIPEVKLPVVTADYSEDRIRTLILDMPPPTSTEAIKSLAGNNATEVRGRVHCNSQGSAPLQVADDAGLATTITSDDAEDEDDTRSSSDDDVNLEIFQHKSFQP